MKVEIAKENLEKALQVVQGLTMAKTTLPVLSNILFEAVKGKIKVTATDLEVAISHTTAAEEVSEEGCITLPGKKLYEAIKELPAGNTVISCKKSNTASIQQGAINFKLVGLPPEEFPKIPQTKEKESITIGQKEIKKMIEMTAFAVSKDETRFVLNGVLIEIKQNTLRFVATDGRRLAHIKKEIKNPKKVQAKVIVPIKTIYELQKTLKGEGEEEITIGVDANHVTFQLPETTIITRLIDGEYPNYEQVIPKEAKDKVRLKTDDFVRGLRRATIFTTQDSQAVKLEISKKKMVISKTTPDLGQITEEIETEHKGEQEIAIGFNPTYLLDVLKQLSEERVEIEITGTDKPGVIRIGDDYVYIVLPMQLV